MVDTPEGLGRFSRPLANDQRLTTNDRLLLS
jgi:hypothetical protein